MTKPESAWVLGTQPVHQSKDFSFGTREQFDEFVLAIVSMALKFSDHEASISMTEHAHDLVVNILVYTTESADLICKDVDALYARIFNDGHHRFSWLPHLSR